jgi:hypothetical protein
MSQNNSKTWNYVNDETIIIIIKKEMLVLIHLEKSKTRPFIKH